MSGGAGAKPPRSSGVVWALTVAPTVNLVGMSLRGPLILTSKSEAEDETTKFVGAKIDVKRRELHRVSTTTWLQYPTSCTLGPWGPHCAVLYATRGDSSHDPLLLHILRPPDYMPSCVASLGLPSHHDSAVRGSRLKTVLPCLTLPRHRQPSKSESKGHLSLTDLQLLCGHTRLEHRNVESRLAWHRYPLKCVYGTGLRLDVCGATGVMFSDASVATSVIDVVTTTATVCSCSPSCFTASAVVECANMRPRQRDGECVPTRYRGTPVQGVFLLDMVQPIDDPSLPFDDSIAQCLSLHQP